VADRSRGRLLRFSASWEPLADVTVAGAGLPPTGLLPFW
jgi:hypothetical protein